MTAIPLSSLRQTIYKTLYDTINNNKPSGWSVKSKLPQTDKINNYLPLIVFGVSADADLITFDKSSATDSEANADFLFVVSDEEGGAEDLDIGVDTVRSLLITNQNTWVNNGFFVDNISDEQASMEIAGGNRLLTAALSCQITPMVA